MSLIDLSPVVEDSGLGTFQQRPVLRAVRSNVSGALPAVIVDIRVATEKSDSYYLRQYSMLHGVMGRLEQGQRSELLNIFLSAADMMRKGGSFDPEALANTASSRLRSSLEFNGVTLGDALKGMMLVMSGPGA